MSAFYIALSVFLVSVGVVLVGIKCFFEFFPKKPDIPHSPLTRWFSGKRWFSNKLFLPIKNWYAGLNENLRILINITFVLLVSRIILYVIAYIGYCSFGDMNAPGFFNTIEKIWSGCDAPRYFHIAQNGYLSQGEYNDIINIVFFPLYPLLMRAFYYVFGNYFVSGIFVSFISLVTACFFFYKLLLLDYKKDTSQRIIKYFLIYPFSMFLSAVYTESAFMALSLMSIYFMRKKNWLGCGIAGLFAAFCRAQGILLLLPVAYEILLQLRKNKKWSFKYLYALAIPVGMLAYLLINKVVTGEWLKFMEYQSFYWRHSFTPFTNALQENFAHIVSDNSMRSLVNWIPEFAMFFIGFALLIAYFKRIRTSYLLYAGAFILISYSGTLMLSGARYILGAFPIFIGMGLMTKNKTTDRLLTLGCIMYQVIIIVCYAFDRHIL